MAEALLRFVFLLLAIEKPVPVGGGHRRKQESPFIPGG
jgi:hypothetical protein